MSASCHALCTKRAASARPVSGTYDARSVPVKFEVSASRSAAPDPPKCVHVYTRSAGNGSVRRIRSSGPTVPRIHDGKNPTLCPAEDEDHIVGGAREVETAAMLA